MMLNPKVEKRFIVAACAILGLFSALFSSLIINSSFRGIDLSDEGMYLLSASVGDAKSSFHNPFGDYTGLLLQLSFDQIWLFRLLGALLLVGLGALLGQKAFLFSTNGSWTKRFQYIVVGATIGPFYYATGLITPSYNWLNLVALVLGGLMCLSIAQKKTMGWTESIKLAPFAVSACWFGAFGKATSGPSIALLIVLSFVVSRKKSTEFGKFLICSLISILVLLAFHLSIISSLQVVIKKIQRGQEQMLLLDPGYSIERVLDNFFWGIKEWLKVAPTQYLPISLLLCVVLCLVVISSINRIFRRPSRNFVLLIEACCLLALILFFVFSYHDGLWAGYSEKYINQMWAVSGIFCICVVLYLARKVAATSTFSLLEIYPSVISISLSVLYAIGSGNGFIAQLTGAAGLIALAGFHLTGSNDDYSRVITTVLSLLLVFGAVQVTREATVHPYRQPPRSLQTESIDIGNGHGYLYVDSQLKELVEELRSGMKVSGWKNNTPLLDLTSYSAGLVFMLGGKPPLTIIPTVGIYPSVNQVAEWSLVQTLTDDPSWKECWLLVPSDAETTQPIGRPSPDLVSMLGRQFPSDYVKVAESFGFVIWKPIERE